MAQYATAAELASWLQRDVDTTTANLLLTIATDRFCEAARTRFEVNTTTYSKPGNGESELQMPFGPVTAVRVKGVAITDYTVIGQSLYRRFRFGAFWAFPPDLVEVDYSYGYATVPDDVKGAVLETAAGAYENPVSPGVVGEALDDYTVKFGQGAYGMMLTPSAASLAAAYAGLLIA